MAKVKISPIPVHVLGVDERSRNALVLLFQTLGDNSFEIVDEASARLFLVNMDTVGADSLYENLCKKYPSHPIILMSLVPREAGDHFFLQKPIIAEHLLAIIDEIEKGGTRDKAHKESAIVASRPVVTKPSTPGEDKKVLHEAAQPQAGAVGPNAKIFNARWSAGYAAQLFSEQEVLSFVGSAEDIDPNNPEAAAKAHFDPAQYLLGYMQQACREAMEVQNAIQVTGLWRPITILPSSNEIYAEFSDRQLQSICVVTADNLEGKIEVQALKKRQIPPPSEKKYMHSIDLFLWKAALWTSRGRIPAEIKLDKPVYLRGWPNLTRLALTPQAQRIAACWVRQPRSLIDLATVLKIPQRYVFSFFTASYVAGLAGPTRRTSDLMVAPQKLEPSSSVGLLSRILKSVVK